MFFWKCSQKWQLEIYPENLKQCRTLCPCRRQTPKAKPTAGLCFPIQGPRYFGQFCSSVQVDRTRRSLVSFVCKLVFKINSSHLNIWLLTLFQTTLYSTCFFCEIWVIPIFSLSLILNGYQVQNIRMKALIGSMNFSMNWVKYCLVNLSETVKKKLFLSAVFCQLVTCCF